MTGTGRHRRRETCRLCGGRDLVEVLTLTPTPPANAFVAPARRDEAQPCYPLNAHFCETCAHLQLLDVVDPEELFRDYVYVSGTSPVFVKHFDTYAADMVARFGLRAGARVLDIGSNDGTLLKCFRTRGLEVLGVDPARDIARRAAADGLETWPEFFTPETGRRVRDLHGPQNLVTANNIFAHADDLAGIVDGLRAALAPDGVFVFEVSYLLDVVQKTLFDTIYHEHLAYHSVKPLRRFFAEREMTLFDVQRVDSHGGSIRGFVRHADGPQAIRSAVGDLEAAEAAAGLHDAATFRAFSRRIDGLKRDLTRLLADFKAEGKRVAAFGAPAKATTLLYHFDLGPETIDFVVDDSPLKQGLLTPGKHIPVVPSGTLYETRPDVVVILAWNFAPAIIDKHRAFLDHGGRFVVPLPELEVI